jgi:predicted metal-dependent phosphoesterase TrpH
MGLIRHETTFYARGDGTWTALGYDSIEAWLAEQHEAAVVVVLADQLRGAVKALEHIAVHGNHDQECQRPPQDCAADALARFTTLGGQ